MPSERVILDLVNRVYDAAGDPTLWPAFLERLGRILNTRAVTLYAEDLKHHRGKVAVQIGFDTEYMLAYEQYYRPKNVYLIRGRRFLWPGNVCQSQMLCPDDE